MTPQEVIEFIFFPVVNEGCRVIAGAWFRLESVIVSWEPGRLAS